MMTFTADRKRFHQRSQKPYEMVDEYAQELRRAYCRIIRDCKSMLTLRFVTLRNEIQQKVASAEGCSAK